MEQSAIERLFQLAVEQIDDEAILQELARIEQGADQISLPEELLLEREEGVDEDSLNMAALIRELSVPEKIKLALRGNMTARAILIRDTNHLIPLFVLENPKITENEIHEFSKNKDLSDSILRAISQNGSWMRTYTIKLALVSNPKTPIAVSIKWLKHLRDKDLRLLGKSKNVPQIIAMHSRKIIEKREG